MGLTVTKFGLEKIFLHEPILHTPLAQRIQSEFPASEWDVVKDVRGFETLGRLGKGEFDQSKKNLLLTRFEGQFFKRCPGSRPGLTCCNYFVLNLGQQCNFNCSYCYLQSFINSSVMKMYVNIDQALAELKDIGLSMAASPLRIGTGEVIDSLSLDEISLFSVELIDFFRNYPKWTLEFKTKSDCVDQFLQTEHAGNVTVSWSVNPEAVITREEHGTASLQRRLAAARKCRDKGFKIAFHIDPMIWHPEWQSSYADLIDQITQSFTPADVPVMSVGALRFQPEQRVLMRERFGANSLVNRAEVFRSQDGKMRYDHSLRKQMFNFILDGFRKRNPRWNIFMCMETPETWLNSDFVSPKQQEGLKDLFDHRVTHKVRAVQADHLNSIG
jgi:spore photoproduct lyase